VNVNDAVEMVRSFHRRVSAPVADAPHLLPGDRNLAAMVAGKVLQLSWATANLGACHDDVLLCRASMVIEKVSEWLFAHSRGDLAIAADAWADHLYVLLGDAAAAGLPAKELLAEVHASNMTKEPGQLSWPGKGVKGPGFRTPDIGGVLQRRRQA
jgi:predicted HAD superfamily Cof-like phosphohydrolase